MKATHQGLEELKRFANQFRALAGAADALNEINSLDELEAQTRGRIGDLERQEEASKARLAQLQAALTEAERDAGGARATAQKWSDEVRTAAVQEKGAVLAKANAEATRIVADAKAKAADIDKKSAQAQARLDALLADLEQKQATHKDVTTQLEALKGKL